MEPLGSSVRGRSAGPFSVFQLQSPTLPLLMGFKPKVAFQLARNQQRHLQKGFTPQFKTQDSRRALLRRRVKPTTGNGRYTQNPPSIGATNILEDDNGTKLRQLETTRNESSSSL